MNESNRLTCLLRSVIPPGAVPGVMIEHMICPADETDMGIQVIDIAAFGAFMRNHVVFVIDIEMVRIIRAGYKWSLAVNIVSISFIVTDPRSGTANDARTIGLPLSVSKQTETWEIIIFKILLGSIDPGSGQSLVGAVKQNTGPRIKITGIK